MPAVRRLVTLFTLGARATTTLSAQQVTKPKPGAAGQWRVCSGKRSIRKIEFWYDTQGPLGAPPT